MEASCCYGGFTLSLDSDCYVVWMNLGGKIYLFNTWLDSVLAMKECNSLNDNDNSGVAYYYVTHMGERL